MKRILLMILRLIVFVPYWFYKIIKYQNVTKYNEITRYAFLRHVTTKANKAGNVKIECHGTDNLPKENGYIMFPNHQGLFDSLAFFETHERPFSIVLKKELNKNFFLKRIIILLQAQIIDREDIRQSMKVIMKMTEEVKEGRNYIIFAEGTRTREKNKILEFKGGSFKSAINAKCPIVPVALLDSYKAFDTNSIKKVTVQIHYLKPLYYEDYQNMTSKEIANYVQSEIKSTIEKNER
ncbi:lysophospholipid acyltransferase family protein [Anaeromicropila herbilytica]|uniref:1-acyl-sn-glycerol-3-phosphate acyltransferase n=1 Tax=Anaeromicropila herbilytica TaxID=2785025 RepID=A0A7R7EJI7_9FIRM|nr:lysophospholipid acyltransferase family protein [Anaeromicropila herbilytica]BCN29612.1 1-acyl-sn-glycerol-3-phosphate acyltransferase [Anaeromicropila herbilytica]